MVPLRSPAVIPFEDILDSIPFSSLMRITIRRGEGGIREGGRTEKERERPERKRKQLNSKGIIQAVLTTKYIR